MGNATESPPALKSDDETQCTASMQGFDCLEKSLNTSSVLDYDEIASHHELINSSGMVHILYFPIIYIYTDYIRTCNSISSNFSDSSSVVNDESGDEIWNISEAEFSNDFDGPNIVCNDNTSTSLASSTIPIDDDEPEVLENVQHKHLLQMFLLLLLVWSSLHCITYQALDHILTHSLHISKAGRPVPIVHCNKQGLSSKYL